MVKSVLIVGNFLSSAPLERYVGGDLGLRLRERGWNVALTSSKINRVLRLCDMVQTVWKRRSDYSVAQVDVFSGPAFVWAEFVCFTLRRAGKPYVLTLHGGNLPAFAQRWPQRVRNLLNSARQVTCPSRYLWEQMRAFRADLRLLPNPINVRHYHYRLRAAPEPKLAWLRAFHSIYNPWLAPVVIAELRKSFPHLHLAMAGPDKGDGSLRKTRQVAEENGTLAAIDFPGGLDKKAVPRWLDQADIFLNTTNIDNTPVSVLEAMASGLPVVSTNVGGLPYLMENEQEALLVPPNDAGAMARAVERVLREPGLAARLSAQGRKLVEGFDWPVILPQWERVLEDVLAGQESLVVQNN